MTGPVDHVHPELDCIVWFCGSRIKQGFDGVFNVPFYPSFIIIRSKWPESIVKIYGVELPRLIVINCSGFKHSVIHHIIFHEEIVGCCIELIYAKVSVPIRIGNHQNAQCVVPIRVNKLGEVFKFKIRDNRIFLLFAAGIEKNP